MTNTKLPVFSNIMLAGCVSLISLNYFVTRFLGGTSASVWISNLLVVLCLGQLLYSLAALHASSFESRKDFWVTSLLVICGILPFLFKGGLGGNPFTWFLSNVTLAAFFLTGKSISRKVLWNLLGALNVGSLLSATLGPLAFSDDSRSLLFASRLTGILGHPNITAFLAVCTIVFGLYLGKRITPYTVSALLVAMATFSITSFFALLAGLAIIVLLKTARQRSFAINSALVAMAVPIIGVLVLGWDLNPELFTSRSSIWSWLKAYGAPPPSGFGIAFLNQQQAAGQVTWVHAHNQLFMSYYTQGIIGLAVISLLLILLVRGTKFNSLSSALLVMLFIEGTTEIPLFLDYPAGRWVSTVVVFVLIKNYKNYNPDLESMTRTVAKIKAKSPRIDHPET